MRENCPGSVSNVEMTTPMALICQALFPFISTFETPPSFPIGATNSKLGAMLLLGDLLLRGLYAFYTEHERCGELEGGVEGEWVFNLLALHLD